MRDVKLGPWLKERLACREGMTWVKENCESGMMSEVYDVLSKATESREIDWFMWLVWRAWDDKTLRLLAVRFVRETPLADGRKVFDLLTDQRSVNALVVVEKFANGLATVEEFAAARAAAQDAAWASQLKMILELGNPFLIS